jgi:hypothetical protein
MTEADAVDAAYAEQIKLLVTAMFRNIAQGGTIPAAVDKFRGGLRQARTGRASALAVVEQELKERPWKESTDARHPTQRQA